MTYFQTLLSDSFSPENGDKEIPSAVRAYFGQRLRGRIYQLVLESFLRAEKRGLTKARLARRIGKTPDVVNRWLGSPSNLQIDTLSDLMLGIAAEEVHLTSASPFGQSPHNYSHFAVLSGEASASRGLDTSDARSPAQPQTRNKTVSVNGFDNISLVGALD